LNHPDESLANQLTGTGVCKVSKSQPGRRLRLRKRRRSGIEDIVSPSQGRCRCYVTAGDQCDFSVELSGKEKDILDIVFANAGIAKYVPLGTISEKYFDGIFGRRMPLKKQLPLLPDGTSIILDASLVGSKGLPANSV
jgi:hypothetical protein